MTKTYDARLATRITSSVDTRLRQLALLRRSRISHLLDDVLNAALPTSEDLAARFACATSPGQEQSQPPPADTRHTTGTSLTAQPQADCTPSP